MIKLNQQRKVFTEKYLLEYSLDEAVLDIKTISKSQFFNQQFINTKKSEDQKNLFFGLIESILEQKQDYSQVRFLDTLGMETFRVNREHGNIYFVKKEELQNKSSRYYFKETVKLKDGDVYISPFDLNVEQEQVEKPYRPMLRICIPVFNQSKKKIGVDVLNYDGINLLDRFNHGSSIEMGDNYLINQDGYFLSAPDTSLEWGFMIPEKKDITIKKIFPNDFSALINLQEGQFETPRGLYTISIVNPIATLGNKPFDSYYPRDYSWKIMSFIPHKDLTAATLLPTYTISLLYILVLLSGIITAYFYAKIASKKYEVQNELIESEKKLRISNQTKDRFFSILSHDLKNASGAIYYYLEFVTENYSSFTDEEIMMHLTDVSFAASQHNKLLHEILEWARVQQGQVEFNPLPVPVKELFEDQIALVELALKNKELRIEIVLEPELTVFGDKEMLKTIFRNLINNAIKYSYRDNRIVLQARKKAEYIELKVIDYGLGMRETDAENIFNLASKIQHDGTENESGTGFGLKLVAELVLKNNGTIRVESSLRKGSSFILSFPSGK